MIPQIDKTRESPFVLLKSSLEVSDKYNLRIKKKIARREGCLRNNCISFAELFYAIYKYSSTGRKNNKHGYRIGMLKTKQKQTDSANK